jgi:predicted PurR-regulated permease PerM
MADDLPGEQRRVLRMVRVLLWMIFIVVGFLILRRLGPVLTPIVAAAGIAYLLDPIADRLERRGLSRAMATFLILLAFSAALAAVLVFVVPMISDDIKRFVAALPRMVEQAEAWVAKTFGVKVPASWTEFLSGESFQKVLTNAAAPVAAGAAAAIKGFFSLLAHVAELLLVPVFAFYFIVDWNHIVTKVRRLVPVRHRGEVEGIAGEIDRVVSSWIRGQLTVVAILSVLYAASFAVIGIQLAIPIGLLVGFLTIIPFVGTFVGAGLTLLMLVLDWQGLNTLGAVGGVFVVLHILEAMILTPKIVGNKVGLGEVGALFAVVAGGNLLGFTGMLLAMPLAASAAVLIRRLIRTYEASAFFTGGSGVEPRADEPGPPGAPPAPTATGVDEPLPEVP